MGSHPFQGGGRDPLMWGSERGTCPGEEYVRPGRRPSARRMAWQLAGPTTRKVWSSSNCNRKWDHCPSAAEDIGPRREYAGRIWAKI